MPGSLSRPERSARRAGRIEHGGKLEDVDETVPAARRTVPTRFERGELNAYLNRGSRPPTADDRTILRGADRPATPEELRDLAERLWEAYRAEQAEA